MNIAFNLPINPTSLGQMGTLILRNLYTRILAGQEFDLNIIPVADQISFESCTSSREFQEWVVSIARKGIIKHNKNVPIFKLWHLMGSLESFSTERTLLSFYELDSPTEFELNVAKNSWVCFSSKFTQEVFRERGVETGYIPLAFDSFEFFQTGKKYFSDNRIVFNISGKLEKRKHHIKAIKAWIKRFGNNPKYALQCAVFNGFLGRTAEEVNQNNNTIIGRDILEGKPKPFNVNFLPHLNSNKDYNDYLNSANIIIGASGGEGWGLPEFHSVALGKHAVILDAHAYKEWANKENTVLFSPNGKIPAYDNVFFQEGQPINQGNIFDWDEAAFIAACESAIMRVEHNPVNLSGMKLQTEFTSNRMVDAVLENYKLAQ